MTQEEAGATLTDDELSDQRKGMDKAKRAIQKEIAELMADLPTDPEEQTRVVTAGNALLIGIAAIDRLIGIDESMVDDAHQLANEILP